IAAARTGSANNSMKAVTRMAQTNSGILWSVMPGARMFKMVVMKLMAPRMEDAPARFIESITMSTAWPGDPLVERSEEHTSELQLLMRISYSVFCLKKKN